MMNKRTRWILIQLLGLAIGFLIGYLVIFQGLFLYRVIPHGGL